MKKTFQRRVMYQIRGSMNCRYCKDDCKKVWITYALNREDNSVACKLA